jgi:RNA polymerase sigma factor (sigma-70 family)
MKKQYTEQEINDLIEQHKPIVGALIKKKKYWMLDDYDDVFQLGMIGLWNGIVAYDDEMGVKLSTFLYMTAERNILNTYKYRKKINALDNATIHYDSFDQNCNEMTTDEKIGMLWSGSYEPVNVLNHIIYEKVISDLKNEKDEKLKEMVWMYYVDELGYQEIASKLHCSRQNVNIRISRWLNRYRKYLIKSGYADGYLLTE